MVKVDPKTKKTSFQITAPQADSVKLVGDFNAWNSAANPMKKGKGGVWKANLALKTGEYQFRYLINESEWINDKDAPVASNNFGSYNSVVSVQFTAAKTAAQKTAAKKTAAGTAKKPRKSATAKKK